MATQGAKNYAAQYSALKRRVNFESVSLDGMVETEKGSMKLQVAAKEKVDSVARLDLLTSVEQLFGDKICDCVRRIYDGEQLSKKDLNALLTKEELQKLKSPEMRKLILM